MTHSIGSQVVSREALQALVQLIRDEYPSQYSLAEIADLWGHGISPETIEEFRRLDDALAQTSGPF